MLPLIRVSTPSMLGVQFETNAHASMLDQHSWCSSVAREARRFYATRVRSARQSIATMLCIRSARLLALRSASQGDCRCFASIGLRPRDQRTPCSAFTREFWFGLGASCRRLQVSIALLVQRADSSRMPVDSVRLEDSRSGRAVSLNVSVAESPSSRAARGAGRMSVLLVASLA